MEVGDTTLLDHKTFGPPLSPLFVQGPSTSRRKSRSRTVSMECSPEKGGDDSSDPSKPRAGCATATPGEDATRDDLKHLQSLEETHAKLLARKQALETHLKTVMARIGCCQTENMQIKRLVGCLNVCKEDFNQLHAPPGKREEAMLSVGSRLLNSLCPPDLVASATRGEAVARTQTGQCVGPWQMMFVLWGTRKSDGVGRSMRMYILGDHTWTRTSSTTLWRHSQGLGCVVGAPPSFPSSQAAADPARGGVAGGGRRPGGLRERPRRCDRGAHGGGRQSPACIAALPALVIRLLRALPPPAPELPA
ncbi:hypothetical protein ACKKBF_B21675 [Auxenochlorella protothecoides x Auxenochlorella symbiontica]